MTFRRHHQNGREESDEGDRATSVAEVGEAQAQAIRATAKVVECIEQIGSIAIPRSDLPPQEKGGRGTRTKGGTGQAIHGTLTRRDDDGSKEAKGTRSSRRFRTYAIW